MTTPVDVKALPGHRIWIKFDDDVEGEVDLSDFYGQGMFVAWEDPAFYNDVKVAPYDAITWPGDLALCSDMLYMRLTGKTVEELFPDYARLMANV